MKIRTFYSLVNDVYAISVNTEDWSEGDRKLMEKYGQPQIDLGGTFGTGPGEFELPNRLVNILSDSPFTQSFDARDYPATAEDMADTWAAEIATRIQSAVTALRANVDGYSRETVETV